MTILNRPDLTVWYGPMPESNGRQNYTAVLHRKDAKGFDIFGDGYQFARSEYPDRVRYEADYMLWLIGERETKPELWDKCYDMDKHSGYIPLPKPPTQRETDLLSALIKLLENDRPLSGNPTHAQLVEHWEYEKTQGRGEADDQLFALSLVKGAYRG